jgi:hypothetical protein
MNDAERYNAEFEQLMRDAEQRAQCAENQEHEALWKSFQKSFKQSFKQWADANNWSEEKRAVAKKYLLDHFWD